MTAFLRRYEAAVFDLDGTLADSMWVWRDICRVWAVGRGFHPPDDLESAIALMTLQQSAAHVIGLFGLAETPEQIIAQWAALVRDRYLREVSLKPGAKALLEHLAARGVPMALATSCFEEICEPFLRRHDLRHLFSAVVYTDRVGKNKTHPDVYLACSDLLGVAPERCVVLEDIHAALRGARAAGMGFVAVYDAASAGDWPLLTAEADKAVLSLEDLLLEEQAAGFPEIP